jgi:putative ABC transport system permease protein
MSESDRIVARALQLPLVPLAWRNARRNLRRTLLTGTAVAVAVAGIIFMLAYLDGMNQNIRDTFARTQSGHARITRAGYTERERFQPLYLNVPRLTELLPVLRTHPAVGAALPRIRSAVLAETGERNVPSLLLGLDLVQEEGYLNPTRILAEGRLPRPGHPEALLGDELARQLGLAPGDSLILLGQTAWRSFGGLYVEVAGTGRTGLAYLDRAFVVLPLDQAQLLADMPDAATEVLVFARRPEWADGLAGLLAADLADIAEDQLEVLSWRREGTLLQMMQSARGIYAVIMGILLAMAGLIIANTMLMTVLERTREMGMLAALGLRPGSLTILIVLEAATIGLVGALAGGALGSTVALWTGAVGMDFSAAMKGVDLPLEGIIHPSWSLYQLLLATCLGVVTTAAAALYPARRAAGLAPAEALRR